MRGLIKRTELVLIILCKVPKKGVSPHVGTLFIVYKDLLDDQLLDYFFHNNARKQSCGRKLDNKRLQML